MQNFDEYILKKYGVTQYLLRDNRIAIFNYKPNYPKVTAETLTELYRMHSALQQDYLFILKSDHDLVFDPKDLLFRTLKNVKKKKFTQNWVHVRNLFGIGSTAAHLICHELGIDPIAVDFNFNHPEMKEITLNKQWEPDWSQAPEGVVSYVVTPKGESYWSRLHLTYSQNGYMFPHSKLGFFIKAPLFDFDGDWKDSYRVKP